MMDDKAILESNRRLKDTHTELARMIKENALKVLQGSQPTYTDLDFRQAKSQYQTSQTSAVNLLREDL